MSRAGGITIKLDLADDQFNAKFAKAMRTIGDMDKTGSAWGRRFVATLSLADKAVSGTAAKVLNLKTAVIGVLAAAGSAKFVKTFADASEYVDRIGKRAKVLAVPTEFLSALTYAAELADINPDSLGQMAAKAMTQVFKAVQKGKTELAGVRLMDPITGEIRSVQTLLPEFAKALRSIDNPATRIGLAEQIFGRGGGPQFVQLIEETGSALERIPLLMEQARKTGAIFTAEQAARLTAMNDAWTRVTISVRGARAAIASELAPTVTKFLNATADQVGNLANTIPSMARALADLAGGTPDPTKRAAIAEVINSGNALLKTTLVEAGTLGGKAFVKAIEVGLVAIGPLIEDTLRDNAGPILNYLPGVSISKSLSGQLADTTAGLRKIDEIQARLIEARKVLDAPSRDPSFKEYQRANDQWSKGIVDLNSMGARQDLPFLDRAGDLKKRLQQQIGGSAQVLQAQVEEQAKSRAVALAKAIADANAELQAVIDAGGMNLSASAKRFQDATAKLVDLYPAPPPSAYEKTKGPTIYEKVEKIVSFQGGRLLDTMRLIRKKITEENGKSGSFLKQLSDKAFERGQSFAELDALEMEANGFDRLADRIRLVNKQLSVMRAAMADPFVTKEYLDRLREVQALQLQDFDRGPRPSGDKDKPTTFAEGWKDGIKEILKETEDWGDFTKDTLKSSARSFSSAWSNELVEGEARFENFGKKIARILHDSIKTGLKALLDQTIYGLIGRALNPNGPQIEVQSNPTYGPPAPSSGAAYGNAYSRGNLMRFAWGGHITNGPESFPMSRGRWGLRGENAQDEGVFPLVRKGGILGVRATGMGGGTTVNVIDQRSGGSPVQVRESTGAGGSKRIEVLIRDAVHKSVADGSMDRILGSTYGLRRKGTR